MGNYCTVSEVKAFKINGQVVDLTAFTDPEIDAEIDLAEAIVERITNDIFFSDPDIKRFDGKGLTRLFFYPETSFRLISVNSITRVAFDGVTVRDTLIEDTDFKRYEFFLVLDAGETWPIGRKNIVIDGTWGQSTVPPEIKRAVCLLALERLLTGITQLTSDVVKRAEWDDFSIEFGSGDRAFTGHTTGFFEIDRLLDSFVNYIDMFYAVPDDKGTFGPSG